MVAGTFDKNGGKPSKLITAIAAGISESCKVRLINGGHEGLLPALAAQAYSEKIVVWAPNVSNSLGVNFLPSIKKVNPHCILVSSKRNNLEYKFPELIQHMLRNSANLCVEFNASNRSEIISRVLDPLANTYINTKSDNVSGWSSNPLCTGIALGRRIVKLTKFHRVGCVKALINVAALPKQKDVDYFMDLAKDWANRFDALIPKATTNARFVGNSSFRCSHGFPSFRSNKDVFMMSRRNVDKTNIDINAFVPVLMNKQPTESIIYDGPNKPSVDTPLHRALYYFLPNINWMIHGHVYADTLMEKTNYATPCGSIEEITSVMVKINGDCGPNTNNFVINLRGHGFIAGAAKPQMLKDLKFYPRKAPEAQTVF